jgi:hypothetical protein
MVEKRQKTIEEVSRSMIPDERVAEVVSRLTGIPKAELMGGSTPERPRFDSSDSLDRIELVMELEEEFEGDDRVGAPVHRGARRPNPPGAAVQLGEGVESRCAELPLGPRPGRLIPRIRHDVERRCRT